MCDEYKRWTQQLKQHTDNNMGSSVSINSFVRWSRCILTGNFTDKEKINVAKEDSGSRIALTIIKHIADLVAASVSLNYEIVAADSFRNGFSTWVIDTFRSECLLLLQHHLYFGEHWSGLKLNHRISSGQNPLEEAIINFYKHSHETKTTTVTTTLSTLDKCDNCYRPFTGRHTALVCTCRIKRCNTCFGIETGGVTGCGKKLQFVCEWCLESWRKTNPGQESAQDDKLLRPDCVSKPCSLCGCDMES